MADKNLKRSGCSDVEEEEDDIGVFSQADPVPKKSVKKVCPKVTRVKKKKRKVYSPGK